MAKIIEQMFVLKLSRIVNDKSNLDSFLSEDQKTAILESVPQLVESILEDQTIVVEVADIE